MKARKLLLPRGYLSWSGLDLWERSPARYAERYFHGRDEEPTAAMSFGKRIADALENGGDEDAEISALTMILPHYQKREHEIRAKLNTKAGSIELLAKIDTFGVAPIRFREYKSGRVPWTQSRAEKHGQLKHYATTIYLAHGRLPSEVWLDWAETESRGGEVSLTGKVRSFRVHIGMGTVLEYMARAGRVAQEIDAAYRQYLKNLA